MNYTQKYHLPQWEESDRVMRTDFNQMCADLENGLDSSAQAAANAQSTADSALAHKNYVVGTYKGNSLGLTIEIGFRPTALIICNAYSGSNVEEGAGLCSLYVGASRGTYGCVTFTDTGFKLSSQLSVQYPNVCRHNYSYVYIAFQ